MLSATAGAHKLGSNSTAASPVTPSAAALGGVSPVADCLDSSVANAARTGVKLAASATSTQNSALVTTVSNENAASTRWPTIPARIAAASSGC